MTINTRTVEVAYEAQPLNGAPIRFTGRGAHVAAAAALRSTGGSLWRITLIDGVEVKRYNVQTMSRPE